MNFHFPSFSVISIIVGKTLVFKLCACVLVSYTARNSASSWRARAPVHQASWPWPPVSASPSWGWTSTPRCCRSWRDTWRYCGTFEPPPLPLIYWFCAFWKISLEQPAEPCLWLCSSQEAHPDYADIIKATAAFRSLVVSEKRNYFIFIVHQHRYLDIPWLLRNNTTPVTSHRAASADHGDNENKQLESVPNYDIMNHSNIHHSF